MTDTDTPRTDEARTQLQRDIWSGNTPLPAELVPADFARALERENRRLREALEQAGAYIKVFSSGTPNGKTEKLKRAIAAALAGENSKAHAPER